MLRKRLDFTSLGLLDRVRAPDGWGVFASDGPNFRHAIFGRDSIEVAEDLLEHDQKLARSIILTLARLQGTRSDLDSEEEPGKIHHEYRSAQFAGQAIPAESLAIMRGLQAKKWSDARLDTMLYYGASDSTPLYVRLVGMYADTYGGDILSQTYHNKDGRQQTVRDSLHAATEWLTRKLRQRADHLLAYRRSNPQGIANQAWKDSPSAYLFSDGTLPDHNQGVVSTEIQGYVYDALLYAARVLPEQSDELRALAKSVQRSVLAKLWMPHQQFFAQGLGVNMAGQEQVIDTLTSNGALLLDSAILQDLPANQRATYVSGLERTIMSTDFLTPAGVRCRAASHALLLPYVDYHGSYAVWSKETADIARGLQKHGRKNSAAQLRQALINSFRKAGDCYELFYVDLDNTVYYQPHQAIAQLSSTTVGEPLPVPEPGQAWSISAAIASAHLTPQTPRYSVVEHIRQFGNKHIPKAHQILPLVQNILSKRSQHKKTTPPKL